MIDKAIKQEVEEVKEYKKHNYGNYTKIEQGIGPNV